jgi:choloylglycine hydrolase
MQRIFNIVIFIILLIFEHQSSACTAFCLKTRSEIFLAKNFDWEIEHGYVFLNERGLNKTILNTNPFKKADYSWQSKYRSITFNQFGKEFPLGGMNEKGLVIEELNMAPVKLIPDSAKQNINEFQLVQYLLDNCKSVDETIKELEKFQCKPLFQILHYMIADKLGNVIIAEFNGYDFNIYFSEKTGFPVLSNNNYTESLKYLTKFQGFGGDLLIRNRPGSNERFVSVCNLLTKYNNQPPVTYSFQILNTVKQEDTRWSLVYDIKNLSVNFIFHSCKMVKVFDFKDLVGLETISGLGANLTDCKLTGNNGLKTVSAEENTFLIQNVFSFYAQQDNSEVICNLLYQMAMVGNRNLKGIKNED